MPPPTPNHTARVAIALITTSLALGAPFAVAQDGTPERTFMAGAAERPRTPCMEAMRAGSAWR